MDLFSKTSIQKWLKGKLEISEWNLGAKKIKLLEPQVRFVNSKERYILYCGGFSCGKSLALMVKLLFHSLAFPNNLSLLGRRTLMSIEKTILPDLFDLLPAGSFKHKIKQGILQFANGSEIILMGLEALQSGSQQDIKKAIQEIKSLNLGLIAIDQLEEVEELVFQALGGRLRRANVPIRQFLATSNPALFWAYEKFKKNPKENYQLITGSMEDNIKNLPEDYIADQLNRPKSYVDRYVRGIWTPDVLIQSLVFAPEHIKRLEKMVRPPIAVENGCQIWKQPEQKYKYQFGVDPSEGISDPASISVFCKETGEKVAKFNGIVPIHAQAQKCKFLSDKYTTKFKPLIIPEATGSGLALVNELRDLSLNVYLREEIPPAFKLKKVEKLGWKTSWRTKRVLISHFQKLLNANFPKIFDRNTIEEFKTFVWSDSARQKGAGAEMGNDDDVMSTLLGCLGIKPKTTEEIEEELHREAIRKKGEAWRRFQQFSPESPI